MKKWQTVWSKRVSLAIGVVLILASVTKSLALFDSLWLFGGQPSERTIWSFATVVVIPLEVYLGLELALGARRITHQRVAAGLFFLFALLSLWQLSVGVGNCGCFGRPSVAPTAKLFGSVAAVCALLAASRFGAPREPSDAAGTLLNTTGFRTILFVVTFVAFYFATTITPLRQTLTRQHLVAAPSGTYASSAESTWTEASVRIRNITSGPVEVIGASRSCGFYVEGAFPFSIPANGISTLRVRAKNPTESHIIDLRFSLFQKTHSGNSKACRFSVPLVHVP